jgi:nicotinate-nucleotide adenylyltransferase
MNVALFGGSFNPPHVAHVLACTLVLSVEDVQRVLVVPAFRHPFGKPLAPFDDRIAMCERAMAWIPGVEVSRVEEELGESRTLHTLEHLAQAHPQWRLRLMIGSDILAEAPRWLGFDTISKIAPPIVLARAAGELPDVSSTAARTAIAKGAWDEVARTLPRSVLEYVRERGLYQRQTV